MLLTPDPTGAQARLICQLMHTIPSLPFLCEQHSMFYGESPQHVHAHLMCAGRGPGKGVEESDPPLGHVRFPCFRQINEGIQCVLFYLSPTCCLELEHLTQRVPSLEPRAKGSQRRTQQPTARVPITPSLLFPRYFGNPGSQLLACITSDFLPQLQLASHLADECAQNHRTKDEITEDASKDIPLSVDLA